MTDPRIVALVGRPNVGKSRLFNRLARRRISIVHDEPGITRDIISMEVDDYTLLDTGGLGFVAGEELAGISEAVDMQVHLAVNTASLILFVVDGREGLRPMDEIVAAALRRAGKRVAVVINKIDTAEQNVPLEEFSRLGFDVMVAMSAEHGRGEPELRGVISEVLGPPPEKEEEEEERRIKICFVGRPNVGKSSLANRLLRADRLIVTDIPGTTRDAVELNLDYENRDGSVWKFRLIDTAGVRRRTKVSSPVEYFSTTRSESAIESADVVFLVLDALEGVKKQEQHLGGLILEKGKALVILVNKWDLVHERFREEPLEGYKDEREFREAFEAAVKKELFFNPDSPVIFASALEGFAMDRLLGAARRLDHLLDRQLPTGRLNRLLNELVVKRAPPRIRGKRFRIYYGVQIGNRPFRIRLFCNEPGGLPDNYRRYLSAGISQEFNLPGCPIRFEIVGKPKRQAKI